MNNPDVTEQQKTPTASTPASGSDALPQRGDQYMWHTGNIVTVVRVDGPMTACQFPLGTILNVPTGALMGKPKVRQNDQAHALTPERHRRYVQRYITEATPFMRAICELEMLMPSTYVQQADGSLQKTHDLWPQWAKDHWRTLNEICEEIQKRAARES